MPEDHFADIATRYDETAASMFDAEVLGPTVDRLEGIAGDGAALELAVGTGRVALPLAARGVPVSGIELSTAMAGQLRAKDGAQRIAVTIGEMATTRSSRPRRTTSSPTGRGHASSRRRSGTCGRQSST